MDLSRSQKVRLGVFMFAGTALLVGGIITLAGMSVLERRDSYTVHFTESVSGLEASAQVKYRGLRVGRVDKMRIAPGTADAVEVTLALERGTPLYDGVEAVLDSSGLTGLKTVNLIGGDVKGRLLPPGSQIPAGQSFMSRVTGQAEEIAVKLEVVVNALAQWTRGENRERFEHLVDSMDKLAGESALFLETTRQPFAEALNGVGQASRVVAGLTGEVESTLATLRRETGATLQEVRRPLQQIDPKDVAETVKATRAAMHKLDARLGEKEAGQLMANLQEALRDLQRVVRDVEISVRAGREDFVSTLSYLRQAAEDMREFSRIIAQDPSALLRGKELVE